jgi:hypothetical protein
VVFAIKELSVLKMVIVQGQEDKHLFLNNTIANMLLSQGPQTWDISKKLK